MYAFSSVTPQLLMQVTSKPRLYLTYRTGYTHFLLEYLKHEPHKHLVNIFQVKHLRMINKIYKCCKVKYRVSCRYYCKVFLCYFTYIVVIFLVGFLVCFGITSSYPLCPIPVVFHLDRMLWPSMNRAFTACSLYLRESSAQHNLCCYVIHSCAS